MYPMVSIRNGLHEPGAIPLLIVTLAFTTVVCLIIKYVMKRMKK